MQIWISKTHPDTCKSWRNIDIEIGPPQAVSDRAACKYRKKPEFFFILREQPASWRGEGRKFDPYSGHAFVKVKSTEVHSYPVSRATKHEKIN